MAKVERIWMATRGFIDAVEVEIVLLLGFKDGDERETVTFPGELAPMGAFMRTIDQGSPAAAGALESKPFHKGESHGFDGVSGDGTGVVFDGLTVAIVTVVGISEM